MCGQARCLAACCLAALVALTGVPAPLALTNAQEETIKFGLVHSWAEKLGVELWHFGDYITRRKEVQSSFKTAQIEIRDGDKLVDEMASNIRNMMEMKVSAVKRIMDAAENMAMSHQNEPVPEDFVYYNSKQIHEPWVPGEPTPEPEFLAEDEPAPPVIREVVLTPNPHFNDKPVNTSFSSVHIPTNVYDRSPEVIQAIKWSENLDSIFINNYRVDPSLSWQFFGSSTGFMRHYPAMEWKAEPVDLFDCRTRAWYIEAATSPKDMIVLVDSSGSMTGQRRDIARHVVSTILDTLGNNDFVNIYTFNDSVMEIVPCFADTLVQANLANIRELKLGLESIETTGIANFSAALTKAFELLEIYREEGRGACCNQAIMLVSDGVPYNFKEIFEIYNWKNRPIIPVRVFTYLIGREVADVREVKWMACANQGYYVHLSTLAEVREQVLQYVPVMARPLVLSGDLHPVIWTPVYAEITDPKIMDYLWEKKEREEQKERFLSHRRDSALFLSRVEQEKRIAHKQKMKADQHGGLRTYQLMTSVSMPVFDRTENATRVANLLGVAGTDVPIQDIEALMMPHQLGVNGYAFIVTNNGYILIHPDLRPVFQDILKPSYNSVDMVEVELIDDERGPRDFNEELISFREEILSQRNGSRHMQVKYHFDNMKRVFRIKRHYFWTGITGSPFSLVVALPEPYGLKRLTLRPEDDIHRNHVKGNNVTHYFRDHRLRIHPDWLYCRHHELTFPSPELELLYFLQRMGQPKWKWPLKPHPPEHMHSNTSSGKSEPKTERDSYFCDRNLMQAVVFDARVTDWFSQNISSSKEERGKEFIQRFGITVAFMATHSGLTRWQSFPQVSSDDTEKIDTPEFGEKYPRAIDEVWYRRAVEQHYFEPQSFVYSVDFNAGEKVVEGSPGPLVTASHAVFHSVEQHSAPAAVVGFQFHHTSLHALFINNTSSCGKLMPCPKTCKSDELDCYVLDDNGFVIVSEAPKDAGRFFGEVKPSIMKQLVDEKVYKSVHITDYQAVCFEETDSSNPAPNLLTHTSILTSQTYGYSYPNEDAIYSTYDSETESINEGGGISKIPPSKAREREFDKSVMINRTRPTPCDQELWLYQLTHTDEEHSPYKNPAKGCKRPYVVQPIPYSNLVLIVIDSLCPQDELAPQLRLTASSVIHNSSLPCTRAALPQLKRRHLIPCINHHPNESQIELCGGGVRNSEISIVYVLLASLVTLLSSMIINPEKSMVQTN
ncbi:voltage-dependent calcium channel subunit straightjacket isoform X2 [Arctopsyche grandis]|uniref:voltage-dependent calcium channel subunit straightjacket isoform X2 n=1 Tax=Arctopsyche grandis TaxID=121162 RepID=UPI00406D7DC4